MKAAVLHGPLKVKIEEVDVPDLGPEDILVKVKATSLCPTDLRKYLGLVQVADGTVLGHEVAGEVFKVGEQVTDVKEGDRVCLDSNEYCYSCYNCRKGYINLCTRMGGMGRPPHADWTTPSLGSFAEYVKSTAITAYQLPPDVSFEEAALAEPMSACLKAVCDCGIGPSKNVAIFGAGPIGLIQLLVARYIGASRIIMIEILESRRRKAEELGADLVIDPSKQDPVDAVLEATERRGVDAALVAVGGSAEASCTEQALKMVRERAVVDIFAGTWPQTNITIDPNIIHYKEIILTGSFGHTPDHYAKVLEIMRKVSIRPIIGKLLPLDQAPQGFEIARSKDALKVELIP